LEKWIQELGKSGAVLFMGRNQPEAERLYVRNGYRRIAKYGQLDYIAGSLCFGKNLSVGQKENQ